VNFVAEAMTRSSTQRCSPVVAAARSQEAKTPSAAAEGEVSSELVSRPALQATVRSQVLWVRRPLQRLARAPLRCCLLLSEEILLVVMPGVHLPQRPGGGERAEAPFPRRALQAAAANRSMAARSTSEAVEEASLSQLSQGQAVRVRYVRGASPSP